MLEIRIHPDEVRGMSIPGERLIPDDFLHDNVLQTALQLAEALVEKCNNQVIITPETPNGYIICRHKTDSWIKVTIKNHDESNYDYMEI